MNTHSSYKQLKPIIAAIVTALLTLTAVGAVTACSHKPSAEESAAQNKAMADEAVAAAKKEILAEQAADKDKQDAASAVQAEEKAREDAAVAKAVAKAKKDFEAEQRASDEKKRLAEQRLAEERASRHSYSPEPASVNTCNNCGVVVSVNEVEAEGKGSGLGVVAGGVVGGVLGNQIGGGSGRDLATIAGAVGGAFAGNKIEKMSKKTISYDIVVRMNTGEERTFKQTKAPNVGRGDRVVIENGMVVRR